MDKCEQALARARQSVIDELRILPSYRVPNKNRFKKSKKRKGKL